MKKTLIAFIFLIFSGLACVLPDSKPIENQIATSTIEILIPTSTIHVTLTQIAVTNVEIGLNIRVNPDENSLSLAIIPPNTEIEILEELLENGWIRVNWNGISGYVNSKYIVFK